MPMEFKDWATLGIALYGAGAATLSLAINWSNRRDTVRKDSDAREPWAEIEVRVGDAWCRALSVNFFNPSSRVVVIDTVEIMTPKDWQAVPWKKGWGLIAGRPIMEASGKSISVDWSLKPSKDGKTPTKTSKMFIIAKMGWPGKIGPSDWQFASLLPSVEAELHFRGHFASAAREPVLIKANRISTITE